MHCDSQLEYTIESIREGLDELRSPAFVAIVACSVQARFRVGVVEVVDRKSVV